MTQSRTHTCGELRLSDALFERPRARFIFVDASDLFVARLFQTLDFVFERNDALFRFRLIDLELRRSARLLLTFVPRLFDILRQFRLLRS